MFIEPGLCLELRSNGTREGKVGSIPAADLKALMDRYKTAMEALLARGRTSTTMVPWRSSASRAASGYALKLENSPFIG